MSNDHHHEMSTDVNLNIFYGCNFSLERSANFNVRGLIDKHLFFNIM